jgi:diaminohydroxyphosphoribosylaminopyrimidine deaminase/5-amino-6-(5-phosphoribosylamino)uracil reductase
MRVSRLYAFNAVSPQFMSESHKFMLRALELARTALGRTSPNPAVGAVIVRQGQVVGEGYHPEAGAPHAEIFALQQAAEKAVGSDIYVTLEPCSHQGRTGPCADALVSAGIKRVFIGTIDPNPRVAGQGIKRLQDAGVEVQVGICEKECRELIRAFSWHITHRTPYTLYKSAMTLDGQIATWTGDSRWVSGDESRQRVHSLRDQVDAIMVGVETILADDPQLTTRLPEGGQDPLRIIVDSHLRTPLASHIVQQQSSAATLIATTCLAPTENLAKLQHAGCEILILPEAEGKVSLSALWLELGRREVQFLLLEGGRTLAASALKAGLINRLQVYVAPKLLGGAGLSGLFGGKGCALMRDALPLMNLEVEKVGDDLLLSAEVKRCLPD